MLGIILHGAFLFFSFLFFDILIAVGGCIFPEGREKRVPSVAIGVFSFEFCDWESVMGYFGVCVYEGVA